MVISHQEPGGRLIMKEDKPLAIMILTTMVLLIGDLVYRSWVKPQDVTDLLVVMAGVTLCALLVFPKSAKNMRNLHKVLLGGLVGTVLGGGSIALRDYLTKGNLNWDSYLSIALGLLGAFIIVWLFAWLTRWGRG
jgi:hypothetical protein